MVHQLSNDENDRLLAAVTDATNTTAHTLGQLAKGYAADTAEARKPRSDAIIAAMAAGVNREEIAAAARVTTSRIYQLVKQ